MELKTRTLIVDDEPLARRKIRSLLERRSDVIVCGECSNGMEAFACIKEQSPDLVFLDIQMPELDGFNLIDAVGVENMPVVVFVTAFDQYAIEAFEKHALDYVLKPFNEKRLYVSLDRAIASIRGQQRDGIQDKLASILGDCRLAQRFIERIIIKKTNRECFIKVEEIDWIEAEGNYVDIHAGSETHILRETIKRLETRLDPGKFLRIHRARIVNIDRIKELQPGLNKEHVVIMEDGTRLTMSRRYRDRLNKAMGDYFL
ncbi:MAG: response regulator [bacterium]